MIHTEYDGIFWEFLVTLLPIAGAVIVLIILLAANSDPWFR
jgi:hypothetical protein